MLSNIEAFLGCWFSLLVGCYSHTARTASRTFSPSRFFCIRSDSNVMFFQFPLVFKDLDNWGKLVRWPIKKKVMGTFISFLADTYTTVIRISARMFSALSTRVSVSKERKLLTYFLSFGWNMLQCSVWQSVEFLCFWKEQSRNYVLLVPENSFSDFVVSVKLLLLRCYFCYGTPPTFGVAVWSQTCVFSQYNAYFFGGKRRA